MGGQGIWLEGLPRWATLGKSLLSETQFNEDKNLLP